MDTRPNTPNEARKLQIEAFLREIEAFQKAVQKALESDAPADWMRVSTLARNINTQLALMRR